jgi:MFS family permease
MLGKDRELPIPFVLAIIGLGTFITALDQTVVVTALPSVMLDLKVPIAQLDRVSWIITAYLLGYTVAMPLIGRLGDVYGYPRVYQASLVVFCIGTSLVAVSSSLEWMVGARVIQAVGGGATVPIGMALATTLVPKGQRGLALGIVGASAEAGSMLGPAYGGAIVEVLNWRWIVWLNLPQSAVIFAALFWLPNRRDVTA